jgi:alanyl-tRNA synthetase
MSVYENLTETRQFACRVIADHARATAFSIADGILPGNEGRNYVLRKIMRRAIYHGREHLGLNDLFFYKVCDFVVDQMHDVFPELETHRDFIGKMVRIEEERFGNTMIVGLRKLIETIERNQADEAKRSREEARPVGRMSIPTIDIATLNDTYGTPIDLAYVILAERDYQIREDTYHDGVLVGLGLERIDVRQLSEEEFRTLVNKATKELQQRGNIGKTERKSQISPMYAEVLERVGANKFHGYDATHLDEAEVISLVKNDSPVESLGEGEEGLIVLSDTPFYAEAGGQVGDTGVFTGGEGAQIRVIDTFSPVTGLILHKSKIEKGSLAVGDKVSAHVDIQKRDATRRNHTATHLVHAALREVLGTHVKQAGSVVAPNYLRFDYAHYQPLTEAQIIEVEDLVNRYILQNEPVNTNIMAIEEAMRGGAMALFGEKYGADVRVLSIGDGIFSKELCGGTHVRATGDIGTFKITGDEAIAAGVRRIRAITGFDAFERFREDERLIDRSLGALKTQRDQLPNAIEKLQEEVKRIRREMDDLKLKIATGAAGGGASNGDEARDVAGIKVLARTVEGLDAGATRQLSDTLLARLKSGVVVLGRASEGKVGIIVRVSDDLTGKVKAGEVIREIAPIVGGRGGGKPDMAEGGGSEPEKLAEAIDVSYAVIEKMLDNRG